MALPRVVAGDAVNVNQLNAAVLAQTQQISRLRTQVQADTSVALAVSGIRFDDRPGATSIGGVLSGFADQAGMAFGVGHTSVDRRWRYNLAASFSPSHQSNVGVVVGAAYTLGR